MLLWNANGAISVSNLFSNIQYSTRMNSGWKGSVPTSTRFNLRFQRRTNEPLADSNAATNSNSPHHNDSKKQRRPHCDGRLKENGSSESTVPQGTATNYSHNTDSRKRKRPDSDGKLKDEDAALSPGYTGARDVPLPCEDQLVPDKEVGVEVGEDIEMYSTMCKKR